jgi:hypothetical protein
LVSHTVIVITPEQLISFIEGELAQCDLSNDGKKTIRRLEGAETRRPRLDVWRSAAVSVPG